MSAFRELGNRTHDIERLGLVRLLVVSVLIEPGIDIEQHPAGLRFDPHAAALAAHDPPRRGERPEDAGPQAPHQRKLRRRLIGAIFTSSVILQEGVRIRMSVSFSSSLRITYTLRVSGKALIVRDPDLRQSMAVQGKLPEHVLVVDVEHVLGHCPKCMIRSGLWEPSAWPDTKNLPSFAEMLRAHANLSQPLEEIQAIIDKGNRERLY